MSNLIKDTCKALGITQKELAEKMGVAEQTMRNWSSKGNIPEWAEKFINTIMEQKELLSAIEKQKDTLQVFKKFHDTIKNI